MRCYVCDRNDIGLSIYHPDHNTHASKYFKLVETKKGEEIICSVCMEEADEALGELNLDYDEEIVELIEDTF